MLQRIAGIFLLFVFAVCAQHAQQPPSTQQDSLRRDLSDGIGSQLRLGRVESESDARRAAGEFANYVFARTGHRLGRDFVLELAASEWRARQSGKGNLAVERFAEAATRLFAQELGATGPLATSVSVPFFVVTPEKLNGARQFFRINAPALLASDFPSGTAAELTPSKSAHHAVQRSFPIEAFLALYVCVTEDTGLPVDRIEGRRGGPTASARPAGARPFGERGYFLKRPVARLFSRNVLTQILRSAEKEG